VTMYDGDVVLLMSLGGGCILHDPLLLSVWWGHTGCLMELALSYVSSPMVLMWCGHTCFLGGIFLGDIMLSIKVALRWTSSEPPKFEHHLFIIQSSEVQSVVKTTFSLYISIKNCNKRCLHDELVKGLSHLKS
jgi:hypothetical protein